MSPYRHPYQIPPLPEVYAAAAMSAIGGFVWGRDGGAWRVTVSTYVPRGKVLVSMGSMSLSVHPADAGTGGMIVPPWIDLGAGWREPEVGFAHEP